MPPQEQPPSITDLEAFYNKTAHIRGSYLDRFTVANIAILDIISHYYFPTDATPKGQLLRMLANAHIPIPATIDMLTFVLHQFNAPAKDIKRLAKELRQHNVFRNAMAHSPPAADLHHIQAHATKGPIFTTDPLLKDDKQEISTDTIRTQIQKLEATLRVLVRVQKQIYA
jgi:hypothetical protein